jgi:hypothetical protein
VYLCLFVLLAFCTYINLLYGVKFSPSQSRAWVIASYLSFLTDAFVNQPVKLFVVVLITFAVRVARSSLNAVLLSKIVASTAEKERSSGAAPQPLRASAILAPVLAYRPSLGLLAAPQAGAGRA